jgi:hypothetical protein
LRAVIVPLNGATTFWNPCISVSRLSDACAASRFALAAFRDDVAMLNCDFRSSSCCCVTPPDSLRPT